MSAAVSPAGPGAAAGGGGGGGVALRYGIPLAVGAVVRLAYVAQLELPAYDPWRHLLLVRNLKEGLGFTLFDGQPYIWYNPGWHHVLSLWPSAWDPVWPATLLSLAAVPLFQRYLERTEPVASAQLTAAIGATLMAGFGPLVAFTCHYGPEAFALGLLLTALVVGQAGRGPVSGIASGLLFGVALTARLNLAFNVFLFLPLLGRRGRGALWAGAAALPLLAAWLRNRAIVGRYPFVFTWDGLATRSADFDVVSTLMIQQHPAVQEALRRLHERIVPAPEWLRDATGWNPDLTLFVVGATLALLVCRRLPLALAGVLTLAYFLLLDGTLSSNFFRIYLAIFPAALAALAIAIADLWKRGTRPGRAAAAAGLLAVVATGVSSLAPPSILATEQLTPPPRLLTAERYFVNSGSYHPESVMYRYPGKRFLGMPLDAAQFAELRRLHPDFHHVLWHDFNLQGELRRDLEREGHPLVDAAFTRGGRDYLLMRLVDSPPAR